MLNMLEVDTGKLSFHLRTLSAFTRQTSTGKYKLSKTGERALRAIRDVEGWAESADVKTKQAQLHYASFKKRALAYLIDAALMLTVTLLLALPEAFPILFGGLVALNFGVVPFVTLGLFFVYSTLLEGFNGQTLGKRLVGLKVVRVDGKALDYEHSAVRNFGKTFLLPFDLLVELAEPNFIRYFDKFAGTAVVDLRFQPKPLQVTVSKPCEKDIELTSHPS
jgi:uncharacterized RDD family membrane protein YckC